jgi:hypothetical protein
MPGTDLIVNLYEMASCFILLDNTPNSVQYLVSELTLSNGLICSKTGVLVLAKQGKLNQDVRLVLACILVNEWIDKKSMSISDIVGSIWKTHEFNYWLPILRNAVQGIGGNSNAGSVPKAQIDRKPGFFTFLSNIVTLVSRIGEASFDNLVSIVSNRTPQHRLKARNEICSKEEPQQKHLSQKPCTCFTVKSKINIKLN